MKVSCWQFSVKSAWETCCRYNKGVLYGKLVICLFYTFNRYLKAGLSHKNRFLLLIELKFFENRLRFGTEKWLNGSVFFRHKIISERVTLLAMGSEVFYCRTFNKCTGVIFFEISEDFDNHKIGMKFRQKEYLSKK